MIVRRILYRATDTRILICTVYYLLDDRSLFRYRNHKVPSFYISEKLKF